MMMMMMMSVTRGSLDSSLFKNKSWRKSGTSSNILQACVLFVKTGIWDYSNNKKPWKTSVCVSPTSWETQKENIFFFKGKNKHWKNLLVLIMWKKNKTKQENPFSGVVRIVSTPHLPPASPGSSVSLCIGHFPVPSSELTVAYLLCYYIMNLSLPLENKTGV